MSKLKTQQSVSKTDMDSVFTAIDFDSSSGGNSYELLDTLYYHIFKHHYEEYKPLFEVAYFNPHIRKDIIRIPRDLLDSIDFEDILLKTFREKLHIINWPCYLAFYASVPDGKPFGIRAFPQTIETQKVTPNSQVKYILYSINTGDGHAVQWLREDLNLKTDSWIIYDDSKLTKGHKMKEIPASRHKMFFFVREDIVSEMIEDGADISVVASEEDIITVAEKSNPSVDSENKLPVEQIDAKVTPLEAIAEDVENVIKLIYESLLKIEDNHDFSYFK